MLLLDIANFDCDGTDHPKLITKAEVERELGYHIRYAILSHRWQAEEVLYKHIMLGTARERKGYVKLIESIRRAQRDGHSYLWIDTCCIDKDSSAELSEAINSMCRWYGESEICYAYLYDSNGEDDFLDSEWFSRGWTLQELIAPREVSFLDRCWIDIGSKHQYFNRISLRTKIPAGVLMHSVSVYSTSVAQRMSWAAERKTERLEDEAYCLMGLFQVNMPLLYGEGGNAFHRLQEEILKRLDDYSIFAWRMPDAGPSEVHGLLADSPSAFSGSHSIVSYHTWQNWDEVTVTSKGLKIQLGVDGDFAILPCTILPLEQWLLAIKFGKSMAHFDGYTRTDLRSIWCRPRPGTLTSMYFPSTAATVQQRLATDRRVFVRFFAFNSEGAALWQPRKILHRGLNYLKAHELGRFRASEPLAVDVAPWDAGLELVILLQRNRVKGQVMPAIALLLGTSMEFGLSFQIHQFSDERQAEEITGYHAQPYADGLYKWLGAAHGLNFTFVPGKVDEQSIEVIIVHTGFDEHNAAPVKAKVSVSVRRYAKNDESYSITVTERIEQRESSTHRSSKR